MIESKQCSKTNTIVIGVFGSTPERYQLLIIRIALAYLLVRGNAVWAIMRRYEGVRKEGELTIHPAKAAEKTAPSSQYDRPGTRSMINQIIWLRRLIGDSDRVFRLDGGHGRGKNNLVLWKFSN